MTKILPNGNLLITAGNYDRSELARLEHTYGYVAAEHHVAEMLHELYEFVDPYKLAALTDAPILVDCDGLDYSEDVEPGEYPAVLPDAKLFWFPDYAVIDPWETLRRTGRVIFTKA